MLLSIVMTFHYHNDAIVHVTNGMNLTLSIMVELNKERNDYTGTIIVSMTHRMFTEWKIILIICS